MALYQHNMRPCMSACYQRHEKKQLKVWEGNKRRIEARYIILHFTTSRQDIAMFLCTHNLRQFKRKNIALLRMQSSIQYLISQCLFYHIRFGVCAQSHVSNGNAMRKPNSCCQRSESCWLSNCDQKDALMSSCVQCIHRSIFLVFLVTPMPFIWSTHSSLGFGSPLMATLTAWLHEVFHSVQRCLGLTSDDSIIHLKKTFQGKCSEHHLYQSQSIIHDFHVPLIGWPPSCAVPWQTKSSSASIASVFGVVPSLNSVAGGLAECCDHWRCWIPWVLARPNSGTGSSGRFGDQK